MIILSITEKLSKRFLKILFLIEDRAKLLTFYDMLKFA